MVGAAEGSGGPSPQQHCCGDAAPGFGAEPQPPRPPAFSLKFFLATAPTFSYDLNSF